MEDRSPGNVPSTKPATQRPARVTASRRHIADDVVPINTRAYKGQALAVGGKPLSEGVIRLHATTGDRILDETPWTGLPIDICPN
jgi:hypothetical protein